ncbi:MAG: ribonuclease P protein component [Holosporales bacterium]
MTSRPQGLTKRKDYLRLSGSAIKWTTPCFLIQLIPSSAVIDGPRFGITASRRLGGAVDRNRAKRRLRELIRRHLGDLGWVGYDYGFIARKAVLNSPFEALEKDLKWALGHLHRQVKHPPLKESPKDDATPA